MTEEEPTIDDLILIMARRVREQFNAPLSDDAAIFIAISKLTFGMLDSKYILPHEQEKLWHSYFDHLYVEFRHLDEVKSAIEKGRHVDHELLDFHIQKLALRFYPEQSNNLEQVASYILVLTAFNAWVYDEFPKLDDTNTAAFIQDFIELYNKEIERFSGWTFSLAVN